MQSRAESANGLLPNFIKDGSSKAWSLFILHQPSVSARPRAHILSDYFIIGLSVGRCHPSKVAPRGEEVSGGRRRQAKEH